MAKNDSSALRKITLRNCGFAQKDVKLAINGKTENVGLLRVAGIVNSFKPGNTQMGDYLKLFGDIRAINLITGEAFQAGQMILPNFISEGLVGTLAQGGTAEFALEIGARPDEDSVTGYVYVARNLVESKTSDRMAELLKAASSDLPQLPAPPAKEAKAETKAGKSKRA